MQCQKERCYSPIACGAFGYCRELNFVARGDLVMYQGEKALIIWMMVEGTPDHRKPWAKILAKYNSGESEFRCVDISELSLIKE
jgi:hypothetical protein